MDLFRKNFHRRDAENAETHRENVTSKDQNYFFSNLLEASELKRLSFIVGIFFIALVAVAYFVVDHPWAWGTTAPLAPESVAGPAINPTGLEITYIANEGVLISAGDKQVLIDGLHREYQRAYAFLPPPQREKIEKAQTPFDKIDLILVSHRHLDHFHPESVGLHLQHNPNALLVSSQQVVEEVEKNFKDFQAIKSRVTAATPAWKERRAMKVADVDLEILGLSHGSGRHATIQNLGHVIKLGGKKLLHVGDADTAVENFQDFNLDEQGIDIAFLPAWFLLYDEGRTIVREHIKPKQIIAVHISPSEADQVSEQIKKDFPGAVAFTTLLQKVNF